MKRLSLSLGLALLAFSLLFACVHVSQLQAAPLEPAALPPIFSDDFESGAEHWAVQAGTWAVAPDGSNVYQQITTTVTARSFVSDTAASAWSNYTVQASVKLLSVSSTSSSYAMVMARYQDGKNYYHLNVRPNNKIEIKKTVNGSSSASGGCASGGGCTLGSVAYSVTVGTWYTAALEVNGTSLRALINGTPVITATDVYTPFVSGTVALGTVTASGEFDDVVVAGFPKYYFLPLIYK